MLKFCDVYRKIVLAYSAHTRQPGKTLPISMNAVRVLEIVLSFMDGKTGRCDPSIDTITKRSDLSRRTVVRHLDTLRSAKIIDWVRRTVKTDHVPGEGPQRMQTSNAYFIDLANVPVEIRRELSQRLGEKLRDGGRKLTGSGPVPSRLAGDTAKLLASLSGVLSAGVGRERSERERLARGSERDRLMHM